MSFLFLSTQSILRRRIGRRVSGKAWSAPSLWLSSSVSCLLRPIRCCGTAWSNQLHCEHGERTEQPWPHILSLQPKLDQPQPEHFSKQSVEFLFYFFKFNSELVEADRCGWSAERCICFALKMSPCRVTGLIRRRRKKKTWTGKELCFSINGKDKLWVLFCCFQNRDRPLNLIFLIKIETEKCLSGALSHS